jgi:hypothetical protein
MDTDELLDRMQDKIRIGVSQGIQIAMQQHLTQDHAPIWVDIKQIPKDMTAKIEEVQEQISVEHDRITLARGAMMVLGGLLGGGAAVMLLLSALHK